jgi:Flp pilus assembly pilin Flp
METAMARLRQFLTDDRGAVAIEYVMIGAFVSILCLMGAQAIGDAISAKFYGPVGSALN